jgi:hypothetical protein
MKYETNSYAFCQTEWSIVAYFSSAASGGLWWGKYPYPGQLNQSYYWPCYYSYLARGYNRSSSAYLNHQPIYKPGHDRYPCSNLAFASAIRHLD